MWEVEKTYLKYQKITVEIPKIAQQVSLLQNSNQVHPSGIASVVLERACEVYQNPGTYLAYQGDEKYLTCSWNGTDNVNTFTWTLNGNIINPNISLTRSVL